MMMLVLIGLLTQMNAFHPSQPDTLFAWRSYAREGLVDVRIFANSKDDDRPHTVVLRELAANNGPSSVADSRYLVEQIGRSHAIEPDAATWIFHWGSFSYPGASGGKELFLRATFRRTKAGNLSAPAWRVLTRQQVEELTGRSYP